MPIVKMESVTIAGALEDFDSIVDKYIYNQEIQLENAASMISDKEHIHPFDDGDSYEDILQSVSELMSEAGLTPDKKAVRTDYTTEQIKEIVSKAKDGILEDRGRLRAAMEKTAANEETIARLSGMEDIDVDISTLFNFKFIKYSYGKLLKSSYLTLTTYLEDMEAIFIKVSEDAKYVCGFYFTPRSSAEKVKQIFASLYFEEIVINEEYRGIPSKVIQELRAENEELNAHSSAIREEIRTTVQENYRELSDIYCIAFKRKRFSEIRKMAVHSDEFFYLTGWMPKRDAKRLEKNIDADKQKILFARTEPDKISDVQPPTKLKNNMIFKPFEFFVKMYGVPGYNEIDPTPLLALTYILFYGIMFGDVGQSAIFAVAGILLYKIKRIPLAGIVGMVGLSGMLFGFVYGSVFGNEEILPHLISPMHSINQMLIITICIGVVIIFVSLIMNIINAAKGKKIGECIFGHNGIAGFVFYATFIAVILSKLLGLFPMPGWLTGVLFGGSILAMYMGEPLGKLIKGQKNWLPKDGMFYVESLFEMFEVILSYFTNTISFLRVGAFAIVHVGMMMVVGVLAQNGGIGGIIVSVIGNALVMCLEGLIVGIQVLRLEYYEMFSRYYSGRGTEFRSLRRR